jgi:hypothetical protein
VFVDEVVEVEWWQAAVGSGSVVDAGAEVGMTAVVSGVMRSVCAGLSREAVELLVLAEIAQG